MTTRNSATRDKHRKQIAKQNKPCALCGDPIDYTLRRPNPWAFVVDHIIPLAKGGADTLTNKQPAHAICNGRKSDKLDTPIIKRSQTLRRSTPGA